MIPVAIFCPPLYFAIRGKWGAAILNAFILLPSIILCILGIGFIGVFGCIAHAVWDFKSAMLEQTLQRQADLIQKAVEQATKK
jgi:hypothetical protein